MLGNNRRARIHRIAPNSFEFRETGFPMHGMRQRALRRSESRDVSRNVEGLNAVLRVVLIAGIAPAADLYVYFAVVLFAAKVIEGIHTKNRSRLEVGNILHYHDVRSVAEAAVQLHFRAGPLA